MHYVKHVGMSQIVHVLCIYYMYMYVHAHVYTHTVSFIYLHFIKANANQRSGRAGRTGAG